MYNKLQAIIKGGFCGGTINVPPSKSMAHRALICASLSCGHSTVSGIIASDDMLATMRCMRLLGANIAYDDNTCTAEIKGAFSQAQHSPHVNHDNSHDFAGESSDMPAKNSENCHYTNSAVSCTAAQNGTVNNFAAFAPVSDVADCSESGSTLRFLIPLFSLTNAPVTFKGHGKLPQRPQHIYRQIFENFGLPFVQSEEGIYINGAIKSGEYVIDGSVSSQFISGLLFALPLLEKDSIIKITPPFESRSYVDLTICAMADFGVYITWLNNYTIGIKGNQHYKPCNYSVEADCSQAAFWAVLAACNSAQGSRIKLQGMRAKSLQGDDVIFSILEKCGARLDDMREKDESITIHAYQSKLTGTEIDLANCPDLGPILTVLGLFCGGKTHIKNAARLRIKESDRIFAMECELKKLGVQVTSDENNIYIDGGQQFHSANNLTSHGDHRIVMAICVAIMCAFGSENFICTMQNAQDVNKSYPMFFQHLRSLGCCVEIIE